MHKQLGLIGKNINYSFSQKYFSDKFTKLGLKDISYVNFDLKNISNVRALTQINEKKIIGFNVTIPYKEVIIPFLDSLDKTAFDIGAVNTIKIDKNDQWIGYNTDAYGFEKALTPFLKSNHNKALILGTGGASKAIAYTLKKHKIQYKYVSRKPQKQQLSYQELVPSIIKEFQIIINCTPLGTFPNIEEKPLIPYQELTAKHLVFDLIYNPEKTTLLTLAETKEATITNGYEMLKQQAEKAWEIWNV